MKCDCTIFCNRYIKSLVLIVNVHKTTANGLKAGWSAICVAYILYTITPLLGFGLFGADVESNLLKNLSGDSRALPIILQVIFLVIAIVHIPIIFFIGKEAVLIIFDEATRRSYSKQSQKPKIQKDTPTSEESSQNQNKDSQHHQDEEEPEGGNENSSVHESQEESNKNSITDNKEIVYPNHQPSMSHSSEVPNKKVKESTDVKLTNPKEYLNMHPGFYYMVTIICYFIVVILSIVVGDVSVFFGLIGATAGCWNIIAGPASFYVIAIHKHKVPLNTWQSKLSYIIAWIYCILGYGCMIVFNI